jgi:hypothetical protein
MIAASRNRGIMSVEAVSLAEESQRLPSLTDDLYLHETDTTALARLLQETAWRVEAEDTLTGPEEDGSWVGDDPTRAHQDMAVLLHRFATRNRKSLLLHPSQTIIVDGLHTSYRVGQDGQIRFELIAQFVQKSADPADEFGGVTLHGGTTIVVSADGRVRYVIAKPLGGAPRSVEHGGDTIESRRADALAFISAADLADPKTPYLSAEEFVMRMKARASLASLHSRRMKF